MLPPNTFGVGEILTSLARYQICDATSVVKQCMLISILRHYLRELLI